VGVVVVPHVLWELGVWQGEPPVVPGEDPGVDVGELRPLTREDLVAALEEVAAVLPDPGGVVAAVGGRLRSRGRPVLRAPGCLLGLSRG